MMMPPRVRKLSLTAHVAFSIGWFGAVAAYLAPALGGLSNRDAQTLNAAYIAMEIIIRFVIIPFGVAALITGIVQSIASEWGLFRHYWVATKFFLTVAAVIVLLMHAPTVSRMSEAAQAALASSEAFERLRVQLVVHAAGGILVLLATTVLSIYKPWGRTPYGRRKQNEIRIAHAGASAVAAERPWQRYAMIGVFAIIVLFIVLHLIGGGMIKH